MRWSVRRASILFLCVSRKDGEVGQTRKRKQPVRVTELGALSRNEQSCLKEKIIDRQTSWFYSNVTGTGPGILSTLS